MIDLEKMTDDQLHAQLDRARKEIRQWTLLIGDQMAGQAKRDNSAQRDRVHRMAQDIMFELSRR